MEQETAWPTVDVLGVNVAAVYTDDLVESVVEIAAGQRRDDPFFLTYLNAMCSNMAADDPRYYAILKKADCLYADGQSIIWASRLGGQRLPERVNAGDFILSFFRTAAVRDVRVGLIGGRAGVAERAAAEWVRQVSGLQVVFTSVGDCTDDELTVQKIAAAGVDVLMVGLGVPLQEKWAWQHRHGFNSKVVWCVGALFEYYGEGRRRAPQWMRRSGLEWVYRLALEPRRLWRRYLIGNPRFIMRVLFQK